MIRPKAHMDRQVIAIEVEPVERRVGSDPLSYLQHAFVLDNEVDGRPQPRTDGVAETVQLVGSVLVSLRIDSTGYLLFQLW